MRGRFHAFARRYVLRPGCASFRIASSDAGNQEVAVWFDSEDVDGELAFSSYTVTASPGGATATAEASPVFVSGLTNGTSYTFTVVGTNLVGRLGSILSI